MQSFDRWQQSPIQGAIPAIPNPTADRELKLALIREKLAAAQPLLAEAINLIHHSNLTPLFGKIYSHVADAHFYCGEAISEIDQHPQPDQ